MDDDQQQIEELEFAELIIGYALRKDAELRAYLRFQFINSDNVSTAIAVYVDRLFRDEVCDDIFAKKATRVEVARELVVTIVWYYLFGTLRLRGSVRYLSRVLLVDREKLNGYFLRIAMTAVCRELHGSGDILGVIIREDGEEEG